MGLRLMRLGSLILFLLILLPSRGTAQEYGRESVSHRQVISGGVLLLTKGWFNGEYERKLSEIMTIGFAGGWLDPDPDKYTGFAALLRFYPQKTALTGFYFGGRAGLFNADDGDDSYTRPGLGIDVGYSWLLGPGRSFYLALGVGGVKLMGDVGGAESIFPSVRLLDVGIAF